ncbi:MAG: methylated-DNA--[protein]-cysteine S-methyltransferase [Lachnospiraceae bacterium]|nr:methylated-DNA--[protein]-cysteine S-methyltransferase [Lachnospiraceae bacterium]
MAEPYYYEEMDSPVGVLGISCDEKVRRIEFDPPRSGPDAPDRSRGGNFLTAEVIFQLQEYFQGKRMVFDLPLGPEGTDFQKRVWDCLGEIPYGETRSYQEVAEAAGNRRACRAVGMANHRNPISIVIPCHRVIGKDGSMTGYGGGVDKKIWLLEHERVCSAFLVPFP